MFQILKNTLGRGRGGEGKGGEGDVDGMGGDITCAVLTFP